MDSQCDPGTSRTAPTVAPSANAVDVKQLAADIINAIPGALGMTPDPWEDEPSPHDGEPHKTVEALITAALNAGARL